jgi:hypothetical protein
MAQCQCCWVAMILSLTQKRPICQFQTSKSFLCNPQFVQKHTLLLSTTTVASLAWGVDYRTYSVLNLAVACTGSGTGSGAATVFCFFFTAMHGFLSDSSCSVTTTTTTNVSPAAAQEEVVSQSEIHELFETSRDQSVSKQRVHGCNCNIHWHCWLRLVNLQAILKPDVSPGNAAVHDDLCEGWMDASQQRDLCFTQLRKSPLARQWNLFPTLDAESKQQRHNCRLGRKLANKQDHASVLPLLLDSLTPALPLLLDSLNPRIARGCFGQFSKYSPGLSLQPGLWAAPTVL